MSPAPSYTPQNHPHAGMKPDRSTITRMLAVAEAVRVAVAQSEKEQTNVRR